MTALYVMHRNYTEPHINGRFVQRGEIVECSADGQVTGDDADGDGDGSNGN